MHKCCHTVCGDTQKRSDVGLGSHRNHVTRQNSAWGLSLKLESPDYDVAIFTSENVCCEWVVVSVMPKTHENECEGDKGQFY